MRRALYPLSYTTLHSRSRDVGFSLELYRQVSVTGFEPVTSPVRGERATKLRYTLMIRHPGRKDRDLRLILPVLCSELIPQ